MHHLTAVDVIVRLGLAAVLGATIGFERQWRQASAGLHTTSLVAIGAALFGIFDTILGAGDTTRIVAGVVTGVGFIAGGVIFRGGAGVTGLNTAATIWATAAVGALAGFSLWAEALGGTVAIVGLNLLLQPLSELINLRARKMQIREVVYKLSVRCAAETQTAVSTAILSSISTSPLSLQSLTRHRSEGENVETRADIFAPKPDDVAIEELSTKLLSIDGVSQSDWYSTNP
jgi:putative Mg2+ transporter-C (MgtC) family protein